MTGIQMLMAIFCHQPEMEQGGYYRHNFNIRDYFGAKGIKSGSLEEDAFYIYFYRTQTNDLDNFSEAHTPDAILDCDDAGYVYLWKIEK